MLNRYKQLQDLHIYVTSQLDVLHIQMLRVKEQYRKQGIGHQVMKRLIKFADQNKLTITLSPGPDSIRYKKKLERFYKEFGFEHNRGRKHDSRISSPFAATMYRRPQ